ncbi:hypothetical protein V5O48_018122, partial [Marasmius crinis-equi]
MEREKLLKGIILTQKQTIDNLQRESSHLRAALRVFTNDATDGDDNHRVGDQTLYEDAIEGDIDQIMQSLSDGGDPNSTLSGTSSEGTDMNQENKGDVGNKEALLDEGVLVPVWDGIENVYRCTLCGWEIVERECQHCGAEYADYVCEENPDGLKMDESDATFHIQNEEHFLPALRSATPLLEVDPARLRPDTVAYGYDDSLTEYKALLERGATRLMCETFSLQYSDDSGIVLEMTANEELLDTWAGRSIVDAGCESWRVFLGREIHLSSDDLDGSTYLEDFLEEALLYGAKAPGLNSEEVVDTPELYWTTEQVGDGSWETKAVRRTDGEVAAKASTTEPSQPDFVGSNVNDDETGLAPVNAQNEGDTQEPDGYESSLDEDELNPPMVIAKNEYESDNSTDDDDEPSMDAYSGEEKEDGFESEREEKFWGAEEERYKFEGDSDRELTEEYD